MCSEKASHRITMRGSPIRTSTDHGMCAPPRRLSQLTTSFIAYTRLGIHHVPFVACQKEFTHQQTSSHTSLPSSPFRDRIGAVPKRKHSNYSTVKDPRPSPGRLRPGTALVRLSAPSSPRGRGSPAQAPSRFLAKHRLRKIVVEVRGLEPLTPCLQNRCSAS